MLSKTLILAVLPAVAFAKSINVNVGAEGFTFTPDSIVADVGDKVHFHYYPGDHSVAQSSYSKPCQPSGPNAIFSGYFNPGEGVDSRMFTITIKNKAPLWLYCSQGAHCSEGMSMAINPAKGQSISTYQSNSVGKVSVAPSKVRGGKIGPNHG